MFFTDSAGGELMADLLLAQDTEFLATEGGALLALQGDDGLSTATTVTLRQNRSTNAYYWIGDVPVFTATFVDTASAAVDPTIVAFTWRLFDGTESTYTYGTDSEVEQTSTGVYTFAAPELTMAGKHTCRVDGTEPTGAAERSIGVHQSQFANP